jgi:hypothetical protein
MQVSFLTSTFSLFFLLSSLSCKKPPIDDTHIPPQVKKFGLYNTFINEGDSLIQSISLESYTKYPKEDITRYKSHLFTDIKSFDKRVDTLVNYNNTDDLQYRVYEGCKHFIVLYTSLRDKSRGRAYILLEDTLIHKDSDSIRIFKLPSDTLKSYGFYWE